MEALYDHYTPFLYPVALRIVGSAADAEDVLQQVWVQVWRIADRYDPKRGTVTAWLLNLVRSRALDRSRSRTSRARAEMGAVAAAQADDPEASLAQVQLHERVRRALETLQPNHRQGGGMMGMGRFP